MTLLSLIRGGHDGPRPPLKLCPNQIDTFELSEKFKVLFLMEFLQLFCSGGTEFASLGDEQWTFTVVMCAGKGNVATHMKRNVAAMNVFVKNVGRRFARRLSASTVKVENHVTSVRWLTRMGLGTSVQRGIVQHNSAFKTTVVKAAGTIFLRDWESQQEL